VRVPNRKYRAPATNGGPAYPLVRYSALQRSDRLAFNGRLCPPPPETPASLSPSLRGGVPFSQLICGRRTGTCRRATASHSSPAGELDCTPVEVAEFLAHLFEREPEDKKSLRGVDWQTERQTLVAKRGDHPAHSSKAASAASGSRRAASASALPRR
jgi:hypothetical protein